MGEIRHELLPNRLQVSEPGYVPRQQNDVTIRKGHGADLQDAGRRRQLHLGRLFQPRLAGPECQRVDAMVSDNLHQRTADRALVGGEHHPGRRIEPADLSPAQQKNGLLNVIDDAEWHWARLRGTRRRDRRGLWGMPGVCGSASPEAGHSGRI